ncbi:MAG: DUF4360 domain-containing protein [Polyangiaceae bacterium]
MFPLSSLRLRLFVLSTCAVVAGCTAETLEPVPNQGTDGTTSTAPTEGTVPASTSTAPSDPGPQGGGSAVGVPAAVDAGTDDDDAASTIDAGSSIDDDASASDVVVSPADAGSPSVDDAATADVVVSPTDAGASSDGAVVTPTDAEVEPTDAGVITPVDSGTVADAGVITPLDAGTFDAGTVSGLARFEPSRATIAGSGCTAGDTRVTANGSALLVEFDALAIELPPGSSPRSERSACSVRVPITIPAGYYVATIDQGLTFDVAKSQGASASLASNTSLFGLSTSPVGVQYPSGTTVYATGREVGISDSFAVGSPEYASMCGQRSTGGLVAFNVALSGTRSVQDDLRIRVARRTFVEGVDFVLAPCR